jgi:hypothetical protein
VIHRLVRAGATKNRFYPAHAATPSDWAAPEDTGGQPDADSIMHYRLFLVYRQTGLMLAPEGAAPHVQIERPRLAEAEATGLSPAQLRERGNQLVRSRKWQEALAECSLSLVLSLQRLRSVEQGMEEDGMEDAEMEAAKAANNRSFVCLQMAKDLLVGNSDAADLMAVYAEGMQRVADAKARVPGDMNSERFATPLDLMQRLRGGTMAQAVEAGRLEPWRMYAVLAFADAGRAVILAPHWIKPKARQGEATRFLATQSARAGDEHGLKVMSDLTAYFFEHAAELEHSDEGRKEYERLARQMRVRCLNAAPFPKPELDEGACKWAVGAGPRTPLQAQARLLGRVRAQDTLEGNSAHLGHVAGCTATGCCGSTQPTPTSAHPDTQILLIPPHLTLLPWTILPTRTPPIPPPIHC